MAYVRSSNSNGHICNNTFQCVFLLAIESIRHQIIYYMRYHHRCKEFYFFFISSSCCSCCSRCRLLYYSIVFIHWKNIQYYLKYYYCNCYCCRSCIKCPIPTKYDLVWILQFEAFFWSCCFILFHYILPHTHTEAQ